MNAPEAAPLGDLTLPYLVFKTAHGIYTKPPGELSERELRHVRQVARKQLDIEYARRMSPWFDLKIILRTFTAFIQKENV